MRTLHRYVFTTLVLASVLFIPAYASAQTLKIISPNSGTIAQHTNGTATIKAYATADGIPIGGGVEFVLDLGTPSEISSKVSSTSTSVVPVESDTYYSSAYPGAPAGASAGRGLGTPVGIPTYVVTESPVDSDSTYFTYVFQSVPKGEHTLDAFVLDSSGVRTAVKDHRDHIGVGDIIVAVGDSITAGEVDDITSDDWSSDGRNGPLNGFGGFEPILNDLLTAQWGYPHSVANEGVPGETTTGAKNRIGDIISRYPTAKTWLISYGTNDANGRMSSTAFKASLQQVISQIQSAIPGATVYVTRCFYFDETNSNSSRILDYNRAIADIIYSTPNVYWGADVNTLFMTNHATYDHRSGAAGTWLATIRTHHPNGIGFQKMAMLWKMALVDRAFLVTDGKIRELGRLDLDDVHLSGLDAVGLSSNNLLKVCDCSYTGVPPDKTSFVGNWRVGLYTTDSTVGFAGGTLDVTLRLNDSGLLPDGVSWSRVWMASDSQIIPTSRSTDAQDSSLHYISASIERPSQVSPILVIDTQPPTTTFYTKPESPNGANGWYITSPKITMQAADDIGWPVAATKYRWDGGGTSTYKSPFSPPQGKHYLSYYSIDQEDNTEQAKSAVFKVDTSAPSTPVVSVDTVVKRGVPLTISWTSKDPESGIDRFMYAIGTSRKRSNVRVWTTVGTTNSITWRPTGAPGTVYYISVLARNRAGMYSVTGISSAITVTE